MEHRTAYRTTGQTWWILAAVFVYALIWTVGIVQIAVDNRDATRAAIGIALIAAHLGFVIWLAGHRMAFAGVFVGSDDVIVRNVWRSHRLTWDAIDSFTVEPYGYGTRGCVRTRDGRAIPIYGIQGRRPTLFPNDNWAKGPIAELNGVLATKRATGSAHA